MRHVVKKWMVSCPKERTKQHEIVLQWCVILLIPLMLTFLCHPIWEIFLPRDKHTFCAGVDYWVYLVGRLL